MPPVATYLADGSGEVTDASCAHYGKLSAGGYIGLVVTEHSYVSPEGKAREGQLSTADDRTVAGLARLADAIHRSGCKVMAQIIHAGGVAHPAAAGAEIVSASAVPMPQANGSGPLPRELATDEIARIVGDFANAAARVKQAGYDAVEIHAAHGYLLSQFYSPLTNRRADAYTGSTLDGRIRLHLKIIRAVRDAVGETFQVAIRLGACDYREGGAAIEDSVAAAKAFEAAGVDLIDVSGGFCVYTHPASTAQGYFAELSAPIKAAVSVPVALAGGVNQPQAAERLLAEQKADLIGVGRAILQNPAWAKEASEALA